MPDRTTPWDQPCIDPVDPEDRLAHVEFCSPFAAGLIDRFPQWLEQLEASGRLDGPSPPHPRRAQEWVSAQGLDDGLRAFRNQELLRIVWRDLCGLATLGEVLADLTTLAEICLGQAITAHHETLSDQHGPPTDEAGMQIEPVVLGLGKLGGEELNLSSDIDLLFCFQSAGQCDGPRSLSAEEYFAKLSRAVISSLGEVRASGFCFRVDTRLRPFGQAGPIACSFAALEHYYQREGREWERYALIKARPVAGDVAAGADLLENLRPFMYRRYIDFGAIEALREMQSMIRAEAERTDRQSDIKRGPGGIREIEFLAQGFQLLRGGRETLLQTPRLAQALDAVETLGLMPANSVARLRQNYITLRHVENRLQAMRDQQTHRIPAGEDLDRLQKAMGLRTKDRLEERLTTTRKSVSEIFEHTWSEPGQAGTGGKPHTEALDSWKRRWALWRDGKEEVAEPVRSFLSSLSRRPVGERAARRLDHFMPMLLRRLDEHDLSPEVSARLFDLVLAITQRSAYLALLTENPEALDRTVELFGRSSWVAGRVSRFPELLDELIDPALGSHIPDLPALKEAATRKLEMQDDEAALVGLNYLKQATGLRLAVAWLKGRIDAADLQSSLTDLAEAMIEATMQLSQRELERRHGNIPDSGVAVIGYGSLGARALSFDSDLDLIFLYRRGEGESNGKRTLAAEQWFARLAQRMVGLLTALTPSGKLYEIDTRLRPNGQSGLLVSSVAAFETYQRENAWTWETQALARARGVAGDPGLVAQFEAIRLECLRRMRDAGEVGRDLVEMREKIRQNFGAGATPSLAIKHGPGGLIDIGFIAQLGVLTQSSLEPDVANASGTPEQLIRLQKAGWLDRDQCDHLQERLQYLRAVRVKIALNAEDPDLDTVDRAKQGKEIDALFRELARGRGNKGAAV